MKWRELVADKALEEDLTDFIGNPANYEKVWDEVHDAYLQMPSCRLFDRILLHPYMVKKFSNTVCTRKQQEKIAASNREAALDIMLARRGKVRFVHTMPDWHIRILMPGYGESSKRVWDETYDTMVYIRNELRKHGVPAQLVFQTAEPQEFERTTYDADNVSQFRYMTGSLTWLPLTYFDNDLHHV